MPQPVLITGVSSGIGLHAARFLAEREVPVYGTVRSPADAARVAQIDGVVPLNCDVADDAQVAQVRDEIVARGAGLWGLVNDAGVAHMGDRTAAGATAQVLGKAGDRTWKFVIDNPNGPALIGHP